MSVEAIRSEVQEVKQFPSWQENFGRERRNILTPIDYDGIPNTELDKALHEMTEYGADKSGPVAERVRILKEEIDRELAKRALTAELVLVGPLQYYEVA